MTRFQKGKCTNKNRDDEHADGPSLIHYSQVVSQSGSGRRCGGRTSEYANLRRVATLAEKIVQLILVVVVVSHNELEIDSRYRAPAVYAHDRLGIKLSLRMVVRKLGSGSVKLLIFVPW